MQPGNTRSRASVTEFLGLRRNVVMLLAMIVFIGMGEKVWLRFVPKLLEALGAGPITIGIYGALEIVVGAVYALPGGYVTDRLGPRKSLIVFAVINLVGYALILVAHHAWVVLLASFFFMAWSSLALPATFAVVAHALPQGKRTMGIAVQSMVRRLPMGLGPVIGGILVHHFGIVYGVKVGVVCAVALTLVAVWFQWRYAHAEDVPGYQALHPVEIWRKMDSRLRNLLLSDILIRFCEQIPYAFVVLWVMNDPARVSEQARQFGWLTGIEMLSAALLYIPVAYLSERGERKTFVVITFVFFTMFPAVLYFSRGWWALVVAFVIRGLKEFGEPARKALIVDLADRETKARTVGLYYLVRDLTVSAGAVAGGYLWKIAPGLNLWTAFAFGAAGTLYYAMYGRGVERDG